jgi:hypothetical protein
MQLDIETPEKVIYFSTCQPNMTRGRQVDEAFSRPDYFNKRAGPILAHGDYYLL